MVTVRITATKTGLCRLRIFNHHVILSEAKNLKCTPETLHFAQGGRDWAKRQAFLTSLLLVGDDKMSRLGNTFIGATGQIDSQSMNAEDLAQVLDGLLATEQTEKSGRQFPQLVHILDRLAKINPHQHITGSVGSRGLLQRVVQVYRKDSLAREALLEYMDKCPLAHLKEPEGFFQQSDDALLRWFERQFPLPSEPGSFKEADDHLNLARLAFQSKHETSFELLQDAYHTVALENLAHGVTEVWFRTSRGDHENDSFSNAAQAAIQGARQSELEAKTPLKVRFLVGMRKCLPGHVTDLQNSAGTDARAVALVTAIGYLRQTVPNSER
jgi:hypothetical protein